jgi:nucleoside-diphosphate-sugar epimerase
MSGTVLITGASGFIGKSCVASSLRSGFLVAAHYRRDLEKATTPAEIFSPSQVRKLVSPDFTSVHSFLDSHTVDVMLHTAARVHVMGENEAASLDANRAINTELTLQLAWQAAKSNTKRFVYLSSAKVGGELTRQGQPLRADLSSPKDPYAISKWEAEQGLREIAARTGMEVVIIRPPLVYGPGVRANFLTIMQWLRRGVPLPFGAINNQRSLVALPNLVDFITLCLTHPKAANQTFLISDQQDVSTTELLRGLGDALERPARLIPVPQSLLEFGLKAVGKAGVAQRLLGDLTVDSSPATELLGWKPPFSVQQGLKLTADHFLEQSFKP